MAIPSWLSTLACTPLLLAALLYLGLTVFLLVECLLAIAAYRRQQATPPTSAVPTFSVLIPAHNEESGIEKTLAGLIPEVSDPAQILVVADNCQDRTADLARAKGVRVLERQDPDRRGKGYALDFGLRELAQDDLDVVVMVDADCSVTPGTIQQIAVEAFQRQHPVQAVYVMEQPPNPSLRDRVSAFALTVKNRVRAAGLSKLGVPIPLGGTGMAFPWQSLTQVDLASGHIVEDMKLGMDLAIAGYRPQLSLTTQVIGLLPKDTTAATSQRTRWEHGHLQVLKTYVPKLLREAIRQRRWDLLALACDLAIPPLALWSLIGVGLTAIAAVLAVFAQWPLALGVQLLADGVLLLTILLCWAVWGRTHLGFAQLLAIPLYILWKIPIYIKAVLNPEKVWVRTKRSPQE